MSLIADLIRAGVDPDLVARVADEIAEARAFAAINTNPARTARQERNARYYDAKQERLKETESVLKRLKASEINKQQEGVFPPYDNINSTPPFPQEKINIKRDALDCKKSFETFWQVYPNKVGKKPAFKAFAKHFKRLDDILLGLERYKLSKNPRYDWLNPTTFLNQERWNDQPAMPEARGSPPPIRPETIDDIQNPFIRRTLQRRQNEQLNTVDASLFAQPNQSEPNRYNRQAGE